VVAVPCRVVLTALVVAALTTGCGSSSPAALPTPLPPAVPAPPGGTHVVKVLTVVEENHSLRQMRSSMPFLSALASQYAYATGYTAVSHPSLPNYLALSGGSTFGVTDDADPSAHRITGQSVFGQALLRQGFAPRKGPGVSAMPSKRNDPTRTHRPSVEGSTVPSLDQASMTGTGWASADGAGGRVQARNTWSAH
jgi:hypothetical protein